MKKYTVDDVMALKPCYSRVQIEDLSGGRALSAMEILLLPIPDKDKLWVVQKLFPESILLDAIHVFGQIALSYMHEPGSSGFYAKEVIEIAENAAFSDCGPLWEFGRASRNLFCAAYHSGDSVYYGTISGREMLDTQLSVITALIEYHGV